jgi:hypothetical protein
MTRTEYYNLRIDQASSCSELIEVYNAAQLEMDEHLETTKDVVMKGMLLMANHRLSPLGDALTKFSDEDGVEGVSHVREVIRSPIMAATGVFESLP